MTGTGLYGAVDPQGVALLDVRHGLGRWRFPTRSEPRSG